MYAQKGKKKSIFSICFLVLIFTRLCFYNYDYIWSPNFSGAIRAGLCVQLTSLECCWGQPPTLLWHSKISDADGDKDHRKKKKHTLNGFAERRDSREIALFAFLSPDMCVILEMFLHVILMK